LSMHVMTALTGWRDPTARKPNREIKQDDQPAVKEGTHTSCRFMLLGLTGLHMRATDAVIPAN
jgi:hypothetical protein